jgi:hypothetical protein
MALSKIKMAGVILSIAVAAAGAGVMGLQKAPAQQTAEQQAGPSQKAEVPIATDKEKVLTDRVGDQRLRGDLGSAEVQNCSLALIDRVELKYSPWDKVLVLPDSHGLKEGPAEKGTGEKKGRPTKHLSSATAKKRLCPESSAICSCSLVRP